MEVKIGLFCILYCWFIEKGNLSTFFIWLIFFFGLKFDPKKKKILKKKMSFNTLKYSVENQVVAVITIDRPPANSLNVQMMNELVKALNQAINDENVRVIVLTANGKIFCAGQDIINQKDNNLNVYDYLHQIFFPVGRLIRDSPKVVICASKFYNNFFFFFFSFFFFFFFF